MYFIRTEHYLTCKKQLHNKSVINSQERCCRMLLLSKPQYNITEGLCETNGVKTQKKSQCVQQVFNRHPNLCQFVLLFMSSCFSLQDYQLHIRFPGSAVLSVTCPFDDTHFIQPGYCLMQTLNINTQVYTVHRYRKHKHLTQT